MPLVFAAHGNLLCGEAQVKRKIIAERKPFFEAGPSGRPRLNRGPKARSLVPSRCRASSSSDPSPSTRSSRCDSRCARGCTSTAASGAGVSGAARRTRRSPLAFAGHAVTVVSSVGTDPEGSTILARLSDAGVDTSQVMRRAGPSTRSLVLVEPDGERTVVNLHRCREEGPPRRLRTLPADVIYVRSRELDLAPILAARLDSTLVVAHVPPSGAGVRPAHVLVASAADLSDDERLAPWETARRAAGEALGWIVVTRGPGGPRRTRPTGAFSFPRATWRPSTAPEPATSSPPGFSTRSPPGPRWSRRS